MSAVATPLGGGAAIPWQRLGDSDREIVEKVGRCVEHWENAIGSEFRDRCNHFYRQYRGFKKLRNAWERSGPNDRDMVLRDSKSAWGANLHIPFTFSAVEELLPRAIAQRPKMIYLPRDQRWEENVESIRELIDWQQERVDIELKWQDVMRSGFIYGLGIGKGFWRKEYATRRRVKPRMFPSWQRFTGQTPYYLGGLEESLIFDGADFEDVDIFDFMWDPYGFGPKSCKWMLHRLWMSTQEVTERIQQGVWNTDAAKLLQPEDIRSMGNGQKYDEIWNERMVASGLSGFSASRGEHPHEVWEWHDGTRCITVLDRQVPVQDGENPCVGQMPFVTYRPTPLQKQMVGIGEIEPIEHLNRELDTIRSQMIDAGTIALCAGYAYDDGAIDEEDLVMGPASAIRVNNADPRDALYPLPKAELPASAFQQSQTIMGDIQRMTGANDQLADQQGVSASATEAMMVQASLSKRIELKSFRFEKEACRPTARIFLTLNQRMIRDTMNLRLPADPSVEPGDPVQAYRWVQLGPGELAGDYEVIADGGTLAAENTQQMRQDANYLQQFAGDPNIDQRWLRLKQLQLLGIQQPEQALSQPQPSIPPFILDILQKQGVPGATIAKAVAQAQEMAQAQTQGAAA